jgi:hypothetical protein
MLRSTDGWKAREAWKAPDSYAGLQVVDDGILKSGRRSQPAKVAETVEITGFPGFSRG